MASQITKLLEDLSSRIDYWRVEGEFSYAETIGALEVLKARIIKEMHEQEDSGV